MTFIFKTKLKIAKKYSDAKLPHKTYNDENFSDLGWDLFAFDTVVIKPHAVDIVGTGLIIEFPNEYGAIIKDRSSKSRLYEVVGGVYDPSFRGEIMVNIFNYTHESITINKGDKFCQMVLIPNIFAKIEEVSISEINNTSRGKSCLGSTGG